MEPTNRPGYPAHTTPQPKDEKKPVRPKAAGKTRPPAAPSPESDKPRLHTRKASKVSSSKAPLKQEGSTHLPSPEHNRATLESMASAVLSETALPGASDHFDTGAFLFEAGAREIHKIDQMSEQLLKQYRPEQLLSLLTQLKNLEHGEPGKPRNALKHSFFIRTALLQASEKSGAGLTSWEVYTHPPPQTGMSNGAFWKWLEKPESWISEAQSMARKYTEVTYIKAMEQMKADTTHQLVAYKGGFGAGKTSHIEATYQTAEGQGAVADSIISSDNAKKALRKSSTLSHHAVHKQASNMAFNLLDGMIKGRLSGTIIFDSALSDADDVSTLMKKAEAAGRTLKVVDITRNDTARALAVLARSVAGEAPRMPAKKFLNSAQKDRQERPDCMNRILESQPSGELFHTYELYSCNEIGSDRQRIVTLNSGHQLKWNPALTTAEINQRLANEGIRFNPVSGTFESIHSYKPWSERMAERLMKPVGMLLELLPNDVKQPLKEQFIQRTIHTRPQKDYPKTAKELYQALSPEIQKTLTPTAFEQAFGLLNKNSQKRLEEAFWKSIHTQKPLTYLDLPALFALEINQQLLATPPAWKA